MTAYAGSIADLLATATRQQASRGVARAAILSRGQQQLGDIAARATLQQAQNRTAFADSLAQIGGRSLGDYLSYGRYVSPQTTPPQTPGLRAGYGPLTSSTYALPPRGVFVT